MNSANYIKPTVAALVFASSNWAPGAVANVTSVIYAGRHFEVRDRDQPTKYVFNGSSRIASIVGSLSGNQRIQRLRLFPGWNLVSLAVTASDLAGQLESNPSGGIDSIYQWDPLNKDYYEISSGQSVSAGAVVWIKAAAEFSSGILGSYSDPDSVHVEPGGDYFGSGGLESWAAAWPTNSSVWSFDSGVKEWSELLGGDLPTFSNVPGTFSPGDAIYIRANSPAELQVSDPALRIRYYHQDHLGSTAATTDSRGDLVQETAFYPFGTPRIESLAKKIRDPYQFTQKERDRESGLDYFGKRFYCPTLSKWLTTDPKEEQGGGLNPYAYVNENPVRYTDPDGAEIKVTHSEDKKTHEQLYHIELTAVLVNVSGKKIGTKELQEYADKVKATIEKSYQGRDNKAKITWKTTANITVISDWSQRKSNEHVFVLTGGYGMSGAGETRHGGMIMKIQAHTLLDPPPKPGDKYYDILSKSYKSPESIGAHEFGHAAGLDDLESNPANLMSHGRLHDSRKITTEQLNTIVNSPHNLPDE